MIDTSTLVKVVRHKDSKFKLVEWKLGNTCNYDCSFCDNWIKDGSEPWLNFEVYKNVCSTLINQAEKEGKKVFFQFTGGEPTLYPRLLDLCLDIKNKGHYVILFSNGSRTVRWWKEFADNDILNSLILSVHVHQGADVDHLIEIIQLFEKKETNVLTKVTAPVDWFEQAYQTHLKLLDSSACCSSLKAISLGNSHEDYIEGYSEEQLKILNENSLIQSTRWLTEKVYIKNSYASPMRLEFSNRNYRILSCYDLINQGLNSFLGWNCTIGIDYLNIKYDKIYRGMCEEGGVIDTINGNIAFQQNTVVCSKERCSCISDCNESKFK